MSALAAYDKPLTFLHDSSIRSLFLSADVAQSVEVGVNMRATTVNDVFSRSSKMENDRQK